MLFFRTVFILKPQTLLDLLITWSAELSGCHIAIDGKTLRGSKNARGGKAPVHALRARVDALGLSAGQPTCAQKSNEIEAIPRLLDMLQLKGCARHHRCRRHLGCHRRKNP